MKTIKSYLVLLVFTILLAISIVFIACEAENPGEPPANEMPDTHISEATAGNITTIIFYVTNGIPILIGHLQVGILPVLTQQFFMTYLQTKIKLKHFM